MMELEDLVPPLGLCKKIQAGEFKYAVFEWHVSEPLYNGAKISCSVHFKCCPLTGIKQYPAPTLQELIVALSDISVSSIKVCKSFGEWHVECCIPIEYGERFVSADSSKNASTAALKLWLKLKGIEA